MKRTIKILDTTLRDGSQMEGVSFSILDKIKIAHALDSFGVPYIEGGFPGSSEKERDFFKKVQKEKFSHAKIFAFGATRHRRNKAKDDISLKSIIESGVSGAVIFGKSWDFQVTDILNASLEENLDIIGSSVEFLVKNGLEVFFDAEHFFDGFKTNPKYSLKCINEAKKARAQNITLCDTNGGLLPQEIYNISKKVTEEIKTSIGIHAHNDSGCAVANSIAAADAGADLMHVTVNGYGERCGNADLCTLVPNLELKTGFSLQPKVKLENIRSLSIFVSELANLSPDKKRPFVGENAFTHKAGVHASAVNKNPKAYEHITPSLVGNTNKITVSELSGKSNVIAKAKEFGFEATEEKIREILEIVKKNEENGFCYESADGSLFLLMKKVFEKKEIPFEISDFFVIAEKGRRGEEMISEATIKLRVKNIQEHTVSSGNGPVNALDIALRKALEPFFPMVNKVKLTDYKVRIVDSQSGTQAATRVLIESEFMDKKVSTVGASENIIEASFAALVDAYSYVIFM